MLESVKDAIRFNVPWFARSRAAYFATIGTALVPALVFLVFVLELAPQIDNFALRVGLGILALGSPFLAMGGALWLFPALDIHSGKSRSRRFAWGAIFYVLLALLPELPRR